MWRGKYGSRTSASVNFTIQFLYMLRLWQYPFDDRNCAMCNNVHTAATNASNLQKHQKFVCLSDSLRKQSTIGTQGVIK